MNCFYGFDKNCHNHSQLIFRNKDYNIIEERERLLRKFFTLYLGGEQALTHN